MNITNKHPCNKNYNNRYRQICTDERRLKQILLNLLSNAVKFTHQGLITVSVKQNNFKKQVRISVKDTGLGIKKEDLPKLFQEFQMLDSHKKDNPTGILKNILDRYRAWIVFKQENRKINRRRYSS